MRPIFVIALVVGAFGGCASSSYYTTYQAKDPSWVSSFPTEGAGLHETLAGLYAPDAFDYRRSVSKVSVLRVTDDAAVELSPAQIHSALDEPAGDTHYGVVAVVDCRSQIDMKMWSGQKVAWMLLENGRLSAWDVHEFASRCVMYNVFQPASAERAPLEEQVTAFRDRSFPRSMGHAVEYYGKGMRYSLVGRVEAAEEMLALGDKTFDVSSAGGVQFERPSERVSVAGDEEIASSRAQLVYAIRAIRSAEAAGE